MEAAILRGYNELDICTTSMVFDLLKRTLSRQLRPVSYANSLERRLRGWTSPRASDEQVMTLLVFGGLDLIRSVMVIPTYNERMKNFEHWMEVLVPSPPPENSRSSQGKPDTSVIPQRVRQVSNHTTVARIMAIFPNLTHFFNVWDLEELTGSRVLSAGTPFQNRIHRSSFDFLTLLRCKEQMNSDFELQGDNELDDYCGIWGDRDGLSEFLAYRIMATSQASIFTKYVAACR